MTNRIPMPIEPGDEDWRRRLGANRALEEAATTLTDSIFALNDSRELVGDPKVKNQLTDLFKARRGHKQKLYENALSAGFRPDETRTSATETARRAWLALKSGFATDRGVLKVVIDEESNALGRLENAVGLGMPETINEILRSTIADIRDGINRLEKLERSLAT